MARYVYFCVADKSFEVKENGDNWYEIIERRRNFVNRLAVDRLGLLWICNCLKLASSGKGKICRKWKKEDQLYSYYIFQNFNVHGRYIRILSEKGNKKSTIIIPEIDSDVGWGDIADKWLRFMGKEACKNNSSLIKNYGSYVETAEIKSWPNDEVKVMEGSKSKQNTILIDKSSLKSRVEFLQRCLVGYFGSDSSYIPSRSEVQKWAEKSWKIPAGIKVKELNGVFFLFEFPSKKEAERIKMGGWVLNNHKLHLEWWSPVSLCHRNNWCPDYTWVKLLGFPMHLWSDNIFQAIGEKLGGFIRVDDDTRDRKHMRWARICIRYSDVRIPANWLNGNVVLDVYNLLDLLDSLGL